MSDFYLRRGDRLPALQSELSDTSGVINLTTATGIYFFYRPKYSETGAVQRTGYVADALGGIVQLDWVSQDTLTPGVFFGEWQVIFANSKSMKFPNDSYIIFEITDDLI